MCVLIFSTMLSEPFLILGIIQRDIIINVKRFHVSYLSFCCVLIKLEFSRQIFDESSDIRFHHNPSSGSRVVPCGRTDRHDEANSRLYPLNHLETLMMGNTSSPETFVPEQTVTQGKSPKPFRQQDNRGESLRLSQFYERP